MIMPLFIIKRVVYNNRLHCQTFSLPQVLEANGASMGGGILILVSDGKEDTPPYIVDVTPNLIKKGVTVLPVLFRTQTDSERLRKLAADTKGTVFSSSGLWDSTGLRDAFRKIKIGTGGPGDASEEVCGLSVCRGVWTQCL